MLLVIGILALIIGIIVAIIGLVNKSSAQKRIEQLCDAGKQKIGELLPILEETKKSLSEIGDDGAIKENATVMGKPICATPLTSPIGNLPCLYYKYRVTLKRTEHYMEEETDANGNKRQVPRTRQVEDTLDSGSSCVQSFQIDDGTGKITVEPQDGEFEGLLKSVDKSETNVRNNMNGVNLSLGRLNINLGSFLGGDMMSSNMCSSNMSSNMSSMSSNMSSMSSNMSRMTGNSGTPETIKYVEEIIGLDRNLTVVGSVCDSMGEFRLRKSKKHNVLVSTKSADDMLAESKESLATGGKMTVGGAIAAGVGLLLTIIGAIVG